MKINANFEYGSLHVTVCRSQYPLNPCAPNCYRVLYAMSSFINGFGTNGTGEHVDPGQSYVNGEQTASTSSSATNGYVQWVWIAVIPISHLWYYWGIFKSNQLFISSPPYQLHNEEIVNHLYNAGFQTGVSLILSCSFWYSVIIWVELCWYPTGE